MKNTVIILVDGVPFSHFTNTQEELDSVMARLKRLGITPVVHVGHNPATSQTAKMG